MKIMHFLPWHSPSSVGGTELYLRQLAKFQKRTGNEVLIICPNISNQKDEFYLDGIRVVCFPYFIDKNDLLTLFGIREPNYLDEFIRLLQKEKPDIFHFHGLWPHLFFYFEAAVKMGIKTVISPHLVSFTCPNGTFKRNNKQDCDGFIEEIKCTTCFYSHSRGIKRTFAGMLSIGTFLLQKIVSLNQDRFYIKLSSTSFQIKSIISFLRKINSQADAIVAISQWYFDNLKKNNFNKDKLHLVEQCVLITKEDLVKLRKAKKNNDILKFIFIGRISTDKGIDIILKALEMLPLYKDEFEIYFFGKLIDDNIFKEIQYKTNSGFRLICKGEVTQSELFAHLPETDMLILPSAGPEMAPLVIQEAFACGVPVIGSDTGGIKDIIRHGENGFLFRANDPRSLANELEFILNNPEVLLKLKRNIDQPRSINDIASDYQHIYESIFKSTNLDNISSDLISPNASMK